MSVQYKLSQFHTQKNKKGQKARKRIRVELMHLCGTGAFLRPKRSDPCLLNSQVCGIEGYLFGRLSQRCLYNHYLFVGVEGSIGLESVVFVANFEPGWEIVAANLSVLL